MEEFARSQPSIEVLIMISYPYSQLFFGSQPPDASANKYLIIRIYVFQHQFACLLKGERELSKLPP